MAPTRRQLSFCAVVALAVLLACGCAARKTAVTYPLADDVARLQADLDLLPPVARPATESGSLWTDAGPGAALVRDTRAFRVNDQVTIVISESTSGSNQSTTDLARSSETELGAPTVFGLDTLNWDMGTETSSNFSGDGRTARQGQLLGNVTARVMRVLSNGDLVVAGQKTVVVNRERQILTLVGSIRPADISPGNRVASSTVGNLTVRLWGSGEVNEAVRQGWFQRMLSLLWPF